MFWELKLAGNSRCRWVCLSHPWVTLKTLRRFTLDLKFNLLPYKLLIHSQEHNSYMNCRNRFKVLNKINKNVSLEKRFLLLKVDFTVLLQKHKLSVARTEMWTLIQHLLHLTFLFSRYAFGKPGPTTQPQALTRRASCWNFAAFLVSATARSTKPTDWSMLLSILSIIPPLRRVWRQEQRKAT